MSCDRVKEQIPECLAGRLEKAERERLIEHLDMCSTCRAELADLGVVWRGLEAMALPEPEPEMKSRFLQMMDAYQAGLASAGTSRAGASKVKAAETDKRAWRWWPANPAWQFALAAAMLVVGILAGRAAFAPHGESTEMAQMKGQVEALRQLVALSMMQGQNPGDRLRGVTYSAEVAQPDGQVEQALLHAVNHDPNVNVRLSAVDALQRYIGKPEVRRALADAVPMQDSPLVQMALIDLLVQSKDSDSADALKKLATDGNTDETVRLRAAQGMQQLKETVTK